MKVIVTGGSGNVGTSVLEALSAPGGPEELIGVCRRRPEWTPPRTRWATADVSKDDLRPIFDGADAVIHLAWLFQPTHDPVTTWNNNVIGSRRVFDAAGVAGVSTLVYNSSVGAYSPGPGAPAHKELAVAEDWPTDGWPGAAYTREKAYVERVLDDFQSRYPDTRVVRMRPGFIFKREAASQQRRLFGGPLVPQWALPSLVPVVPAFPGLKMQVLHTSDVARAFRLALSSDASGAFNLASDPPMDAALIAEVMNARVIPFPLPLLRTALSVAWWAHLVPATRGLFDAVLHLPMMNTDRAREVLGWHPEVTARDALSEAVTGMHDHSGMATPPLLPARPGGRIREVETGVGARP